MTDQLVRALVTIGFGALAGGVTNTIAIWMLFHPYEPPKLGRWRVRFLQGAVPKNQPRLAAAIGRTVGNRLLTPEDLQRTFTNVEFRQAFDQRLGALRGGDPGARARLGSRPHPRVPDDGDGVGPRGGGGAGAASPGRVPRLGALRGVHGPARRRAGGGRGRRAHRRRPHAGARRGAGGGGGRVARERRGERGLPPRGRGLPGARLAPAPGAGTHLRGDPAPRPGGRRGEGHRRLPAPGHRAPGQAPRGPARPRQARVHHPRPAPPLPAGPQASTSGWWPVWS